MAGMMSVQRTGTRDSKLHSCCDMVGILQASQWQTAALLVSATWLSWTAKLARSLWPGRQRLNQNWVLMSSLQFLSWFTVLQATDIYRLQSPCMNIVYYPTTSEDCFAHGIRLDPVLCNIALRSCRQVIAVLVAVSGNGSLHLLILICFWTRLGTRRSNRGIM